MDVRAKLESGLEKLNFAASEQECIALLSYLELLEKWNKTYNLTAIKNIEDMLVRHVFDSLAVLPLIQEGRVIDVGTGGGLPGVILAIFRPECQITLLDSRGKKTRFLGHVARELNLANLNVINSRVEEYKPEKKYDVVVTRAFASLEKMVQLCSHLITQKGVFQAMKGPGWRAEKDALPATVKIKDTRELIVPGLLEERWLVTLAPVEKFL
ncbi:MAG: 16S rRNA (guanine(527)-N(7))-methyltransferase RsmG [bacterium]